MDLEDLSRDELLKEAKRLGLRGLTQKKADVIRAAVTEKRQEMVEAGDDPDAEPEVPVQGDALTHEQYQALRKSDDATIQAKLDEQPNMNPLWKKAFEKELADRAKKRADEAEIKSRQTPMDGYFITKGGAFVVNGRIHQLHAGGVVYETTHNLADLKQQGIEFEPMGDRELVVVKGNLGVPITKVVTKS